MNTRRLRASVKRISNSNHNAQSDSLDSNDAGQASTAKAEENFRKTVT